MNRRSVAELAQVYARCAAGDLDVLLAERLARDERCPVARYVAGCRCFDLGRPATGVQHLMIAHHAEPELESAALLVFAGLNQVSRPGVPLLRVLLETWEEFRRPDFDRLPKERALLDAFAARAPGLERLSLLTRRLWRLPIELVRRQVVAAVAAGDGGLYTLLAALA